MEFKVGDKVKEIKDNYNLGLIIGIDTKGRYLVESYKKNESLHNGIGSNLKEGRYGTNRNCWYFVEDEIELVEEHTIKQNTLPKQVFFNDKKKTTVLKWEDDSITKVKCHDDEFDERTGFLIAYFQKTCGLTKNKANKYLESLVPEDKPIEEEYEIFIEENDTPIEILDTEEDMVFSVYKFLEENDTPIEILDTEEDMVFSVYKFLEENENNKNSLRTGWPQECDGKTREECGKLDFVICEDWLVPRSQYKPYKEN